MNAWYFDYLIGQGYSPDQIRTMFINNGMTPEQFGDIYSQTNYYSQTVNAPIGPAIGDGEPVYNYEENPGMGGYSNPYATEGGDPIVPVADVGTGPVDPSFFDVNTGTEGWDYGPGNINDTPTAPPPVVDTAPDPYQMMMDDYRSWLTQNLRPSTAGAFYREFTDRHGPQAAAFLQNQMSPGDYQEMYQNWQTMFPLVGTDSNLGAVVDNNAGAVTDANVGNGGAATGGATGGGGSIVGVPQGGNATTGSQTAPAGTAGTGGNTAPGAGTAGQGDYLTAPARDPNNPNDFSWMNFNKGAGGALTPPAQLPTVANSATGIVTRNANMSLTPLQQKMGGIVGKKPGMFSV